MSKLNGIRRALGLALGAALFAGTGGMDCGSPQGGGGSCVAPRKAVVLDLDGTITDDLVAPWAVRSGTAELFQAYRDKGYEVILLTGRWTGDLSGFEGISPAHVADFLGIPLCQEVCVCVLPDLEGGCLEQVCEEVCVPADKLIDISNIIPIATPELMAWLTDLWIELNGLPEPDQTINSPTFILPVEIITFKIAIMQELIAEGVELAYAYGDDAGDFVAYSAVNIPAERTFSTRRLLTQSECLGEGFADCIEDGFEPHVAQFVSTVPPVCDTP